MFVISLGLLSKNLAESLYAIQSHQKRWSSRFAVIRGRQPITHLQSERESRGWCRKEGAGTTRCSYFSEGWTTLLWGVPQGTARNAWSHQVWVWATARQGPFPAGRVVTRICMIQIKRHNCTSKIAQKETLFWTLQACDMKAGLLFIIKMILLAWSWHWQDYCNSACIVCLLDSSCCLLMSQNLYSKFQPVNSCIQTW